MQLQIMRGSNRHRVTRLLALSPAVAVVVLGFRTDSKTTHKTKKKEENYFKERRQKKTARDLKKIKIRELL